jgi:CRP/FNR family cyclic AMP-dependent transcriptional regulator
MGLKERFENAETLVEALRAQKIVMGDKELAEEISREGILVEFAPGEILMRQGDADRDMFFLVAGKTQVIVNGVRLYPRAHGVTVGEMSAVNPHVARSATIEAAEETVAWRIAHDRLEKIGEKFPAIWKRIAVELAGRLEQRNQLINRANEVARIFIICSAEALEIAKSIRIALEHDAQVVIWSDENIFPPGSYALEALENEVNLADFGIALAEPDDLVTSRHKTSSTPRDNVIFELGFFMSRLGRPRTLLLVPKSQDVKLPSDFKGLTPIPYDKGKTAKDMSVALGPTADRISSLVKQLGVRSSIAMAR